MRVQWICHAFAARATAGRPPRRPMVCTGRAKASRYARSTGPVSRCGSRVTNTAAMRRRCAGGSASRSWPRSARVIGQTSGQWVYPKNTRTTLPRICARSNGWPSVRSSDSADAGRPACGVPHQASGVPAGRRSSARMSNAPPSSSRTWRQRKRSRMAMLQHRRGTVRQEPQRPYQMPFMPMACTGC
ncbi:hypothetical protein GALL_493580 [mine drainage metagenome]|uniref:Uncharacterized protein n=1 Tax=mine drainage metagenome TaxID=410659 RepID=A0A1J5PN79_9ZZZZ